MEEVKVGIQQIQEQRPDLSEDKAVNTILFTWVMSCYMNAADESEIKAAITDSLTREQQDVLFSPAPVEGRTQSLKQASVAQWQLMESAVKKFQESNAQKQKQQQQQQQQQQKSSDSQSYQSDPRASAAPPVPAQNPLVAVAALFGVFFIIGFAASKLIKNEEGDSKKEKSTKSQKKAMQAEKKQNKKMR